MMNMKVKAEKPKTYMKEFNVKWCVCMNVT